MFPTGIGWRCWPAGERHLVELLGSVKLIELKVRDVDFALGKLAKRLSTKSIRLARMILIQAIRNAMVTDYSYWNRIVDQWGDRRLDGPPRQRSGS
jgi:hypothetical protein